MTQSSATAAPKPASTPEPPPAASSAAPAASSGKAPRTPPPTGSPMPISEGEKEVITSYSVGGGISRVGGVADLVVSRGALAELRGFIFGLNTGKNMLKVTPYKGQIGEIYRLFIFIEEASHQPVNVNSSGPPFQIKLPIKGAKTANLAIGANDNGKIKYTVVAPKSVLEADGGNTAVFELSALPGDAVLHLTSAAP